MSLAKNIAAGYASQLYVTLIGIVLVPLYVKLMGAEAYGLIGFFSMVQAWFNLLDIGLTPTIARESARYRGGGTTALAFRQLFRALSLIFVVLACAGGGALWLLTDWLASQWLHVKHLAHADVVLSLRIIAVSVALRWLAGLFRGVIVGAERLVWLSGFASVIATMRYVAVFATMAIWGHTVSVFFLHQMVVATLEVAGLFFYSRILLPHRREIGGQRIAWSIKPVRTVLKFSLGIAFSSSVWVLVTQTDKMVLSGILPLDEYGLFTLAVLVAGGIMVVSGPISNSIMPRMARLHAENNNDELRRVYRGATKLVVAIAGSAAVSMAFSAEPLVYAWSGNAELASKAAPILQLYAIGNGLLIVSAFPYYLQYANGNLRFHLIGNLITLLGLIPAIIYAASHYGAVGAGWVWMSFHLAGFLFWTAYIHHKLSPGLHREWLLRDVLAPASAMIVVAICVSLIPFDQHARMSALIHTISMVFASMATAVSVTPVLRRRLIRIFQK